MVKKTQRADLIKALLLVLGSMLGFLLWGIISTVFLNLNQNFLPLNLRENHLFLLLLSESGAAVIGFLTLTGAGYWRKKQTCRINLLSGIRLGRPVLIWAMLLASLIIIGQLSLGAKWVAADSWIYFLFYLLAVGIFEEFIFRGVLLESLLDFFAFSRKGIWKAAVVSSLIFGFYHLINVLAGASVSASLFQAFCASVTGFFLAALYIRTRNILVCVFYHAFWDGCVAISLLLGSTELVNENAVSWQEVCFGFILVLPALLTACSLLWKYRPPQPPSREACSPADPENHIETQEAEESANRNFPGRKAEKLDRNYNW